jgi:hypothetical protein
MDDWRLYRDAHSKKLKKKDGPYKILTFGSALEVFATVYVTVEPEIRTKT